VCSYSYSLWWWTVYSSRVFHVVKDLITLIV
jgi:hypothetical protein